MLLLDTCALIWWTLDPAQLSEKAALSCGNINDSGAFISSISIWEIGIKIKKGKLDLGMTLLEYVSKIKQLNTIEILPVDETVWIENVSLTWSHRDPADRTIVATAKIFNIPIVTRDEVIRDFYNNVIW